MIRSATALAALCAVLAGFSPAGAQPPVIRPSDLSERARARVYRLRVRIEPTWVAEPGECQGLDLSDLRVSLRGDPVRDAALLRLEREQEPAVHALLIDTSHSMIGRLDAVRDAAVRYVEQLRPEHERALIVTFDEGVVLQQAVTADRERLIDAIGRVRMSRETAMHDALVYTLRELSVWRERAVVLLLSDGVDTSSLHDRGDVFEQVERRSDLTIFPVGLGLPPLRSSGPDGLLSTRKFLQQLALRTNGRFFDVPTSSRLDSAYRRIRRALENEATLSVVDPDPGAPPGKVRIRAAGEGCRVQVLRELDLEGAESGLAGEARSFPVQPADVLIDPLQRLGIEETDPACDRASGQPWRIDALDGSLSGCALDVTMDYGPLYDPFPRGWVAGNAWLRLRTRPLEIPVPPVGELPDDPERLLDRLAAQGLAVANRPIDLDPRRLPPEAHARPHHDYPGLAEGRTFFDLRPALAQALYAREEYRDYSHERLRAETDRELAQLKARLGRLAPDRSDDELEAVLAQSDEAQRARSRALRPSIADLERLLTAWLGDVPAHQLFARWEARHVIDLLGGAHTDDSFIDGWVELRRIFWLPSYNRVLTLLAPGRDPQLERVGYWRVILPRPGWLAQRVKGYEDHPEFSHLPLDLIPDLPLGFWVAREIVTADPRLAGALRARGYTTGEVTYELLGKPREHDPVRAFRRTRVTLVLGGGSGSPPAALRAVAEVSLRGNPPHRLPRLERLAFAGADPELAALLESRP